MPSPTVRDTIRQRMTDFWSATPWFDLSDFVSMSDLPTNDTAPFVLVQFVSSTDEMITIAGDNGTGAGYREQGTIMFHYVIPTGFDNSAALPQMEQLRDLFKNRRFGDVVVEGFDPFTDQAGAAIEIDGPWKGWSATMDFYTDTVGK